MNHQFYSKARAVDRLTEAYSPESLAAIEALFEAKGIEDYFFRARLPDAPSFARWLLPLAARGYFSGEKNPRPREVERQPGTIAIPLWNVLPYLERVTEQNQNAPNHDIRDTLIEIANDVTGYRDAQGHRIDNYRTDWFMVKILCKLPAEKWADRHIDFIGEALDTQFGSGVVDHEIGNNVLPALIKGRRIDLIKRLLNIILGFKPGRDPASEKIDPVMEEYWLKEAVTGANTEQIASLCGLEALDIVIGKMQQVASVHKHVFPVWVPSIEPSAQTKFPDKYASQLVSFAREMLERGGIDEVRERVAGLATQEDPIFRRLAVHTINRRYARLQDLFWNWQGNPLTDLELHHELYVLLEQNCKTFADWQMNKVMAWIEGVEHPDPTHPRKELWDAWKRKVWLTALKGTDDSRVKGLFERYNQKLPDEVDHPSFLNWSAGGFARNLSPKPVADLSVMANQDIAVFLNEWKEEPRWGLEILSRQGLSDALKQCVQENPDKFARDMSPFLGSPEIHQHDLLRGLKAAWDAKKAFPVAPILTFIEALIGPGTFWEKKYAEHGENYRNWLIRDVAEFLEAGTRSHEHAFGPEHLPKIESLLLDLMNKAESVVLEETKIIHSVLSSPRACVFSAAICYALYHASLYAKDEEVRWPDAIREAFDRHLDPARETAIDFWVTLGRYIPNLMYLDRRWLLAEMHRIFPQDSDEHWVASFGGYLSDSYGVYKEIYVELKKRGYYRRALETDFRDRYVTEKLIQHICVAFLEDWESVADADSLIMHILKLANAEQLGEVVHFLGTLEGDEPRTKLKRRIKPLWKALFELLRPKEQQAEYQRVISDLHLWLGAVDRIDEEIREWTLLTAKYIGVQYRESGLVKELARHADQSPRQVGDIYIEMLNAGTYPDYDKKDILHIVESLYREGAKERADTICNMHGEVGDYSLRPLYEECNREQDPSKVDNEN